MFKFGFCKEDAGDCADDVEPETAVLPEQSGDREATIWLKSEEIIAKKRDITPEFLEESEPHLQVIEIEDQYMLRHVSCEIVTKLLEKRKKAKGGAVRQAEEKQSDLLPAIYEGGLKIWQCTYDLLDYIYNNNIHFKGKKVLDLGCGAGVVGIFAYINGAKVYFQDYNTEVLENITIPNVFLNSSDRTIDDCRFYNGDWRSFVEVTAEDFEKDDDKFDYILTSETIYNCDNYRKLNLVFKERLKKGGAIYIAAKTYYFGVGGGTRQFEDMLKADDCFNYEVSWKVSETVQREILTLRFKS